MKYILFFSKDFSDKEKLEKILKLKKVGATVINTAEYDGCRPSNVTSVLVMGHQLLSEKSIIDFIDNTKVYITIDIEELKESTNEQRQLFLEKLLEFSSISTSENIDDWIRILEKIKETNIQLSLPKFKIPQDLSYDELQALLLMVKYLGEENVVVTIGSDK